MISARPIALESSRNTKKPARNFVGRLHHSLDTGQVPRLGPCFIAAVQSVVLTPRFPPIGEVGLGAEPRMVIYDRDS